MADKTFGSSAGLTILAEDQATPANGMVAHVTSSWNSGYQNGDIKGAYLSDTDDTDLVGGTDADRSVNGNDLTVNGTITRTAVATGADLVAYSDFSASNYLSQAYNADLDFGTGDFCVMGWGLVASSAGGNMVGRFEPSSTAPDWEVRMAADGSLAFKINSSDIVAGSQDMRTGVWFHAAVLRNSGVIYLYINGVLIDAAADATDLNNTSALLGVGVRNISSPDVNWDGSLALLRISATAPTAEQVAKIYNDEKVLFQEGAGAVLAGTSDAVTALAHDSSTGLLHVGTSYGRSVFQGLRRVSNTTTAVGTAISASNNLIVEE